MGLSAGNDQKFLAFAPNCVSLQTLISSSVSLTYTVTVHHWKPLSGHAWPRHWCQGLGQHWCLCSPSDTQDANPDSALPRVFSVLDPYSNEEIPLPVWGAFNSPGPMHWGQYPHVSFYSAHSPEIGPSPWPGSDTQGRPKTRRVHLSDTFQTSASFLSNSPVIQKAPSLWLFSYGLSLCPTHQEGLNLSGSYTLDSDRFLPFFFFHRIYPEKVNFVTKTPAFK